jgi:catechol 2,3-dioxygenase-like lactoylglutathione lyase family enzyme
MRLDHIAFRTKDRNATANFFINALNYRIQTEFTIDFGEGDTAKCIALEPSEKPKLDNFKFIPWVAPIEILDNNNVKTNIEYHLAPEIFVSDGTPDSIVGKWVQQRNNIGGIHHIAFMVESVENTMKEWKEKGYAEFTSDIPMKCPGLTQVFTKPSELTGIIFEFIERGENGFCKDNVKELMKSSKGF